MSLFHSSHQQTDTHVTEGFSPHIRFGGFFTCDPSQIKHHTITVITYHNELDYKLCTLHSIPQCRRCLSWTRRPDLETNLAAAVPNAEKSPKPFSRVDGPGMETTRGLRRVDKRYCDKTQHHTTFISQKVTVTKRSCTQRSSHKT